MPRSHDDALQGCFTRLHREGFLEAINIIIDELGGLRVWVPTRKSLLTATRNQIIRNRFTGFNTLELSFEFKLTERQIRRIVK